MFDLNFPAPNKFLREKSTGRDFLGQQSIIQYMANRCLPSFTNATKKIRYYSFWAWAFEMLRRNIEEFSDEDEVWWYLLKLETALIISNKKRNPEITGMPGIQGIPYNDNAIREFKSNTVVKIYSDLPRATSYSPVQYSPSLGTLNIVKKQGTNINILKFGKDLSKIFDHNINKFKGYNMLVSPNIKTIKWKYLEEMNKALSLESITEKEKHVFIEIIEQNEFRGPYSKNISPRIYTTLFVLDLIGSCTIKNMREFLDSLWRDKYHPPALLRDISEDWKIIEARRYYQLAIEGILSSFCQYISSFKAKKGDFIEFSNDVAQNLSKYAFFNDNFYPFKNIIKTNRSLSEYIQKIVEVCNEVEVDELDLIRRIEGNVAKHKGFNYEMIHNAIILLLLLHSKFNSLKNLKSKRAKLFWVAPYGFKHSFKLIDDLINKWSSLEVEKGIQKIIVELSLKLHLGVSQDKWFQTGNFTFRFTRNEPTGFRLLSHMSPNMTSNKLLAYIQLISDLGFIKTDSGLFKLTDAGSTYLKTKFKELSKA